MTLYYLSISNQVELSAGITPKLAAADEGTKPLCAILFDLFIRIVHIKVAMFPTLLESNYCLLIAQQFCVFNPGTPNISIDSEDAKVSQLSI